jgi:ribosomal protein S18 acetylase RimI-like enzyme
MSIDIKHLVTGDEAILENIAPDVFDDPLDVVRAKEFLGDQRHHLIVALDGNSIVGFVSAVHYIHPDKAHPELWINEVGVAKTHQQRGIGKAMMEKIFEVGLTLGCKEAWVLTEQNNTAAIKLYSSSGGIEGAPILFTFRLDGNKEKNDY